MVLERDAAHARQEAAGALEDVELEALAVDLQQVDALRVDELVEAYGAASREPDRRLAMRDDVRPTTRVVRSVLLEQRERSGSARSAIRVAEG